MLFGYWCCGLDLWCCGVVLALWLLVYSGARFDICFRLDLGLVLIRWFGVGTRLVFVAFGGFGLRFRLFGRFGVCILL